ncbi:MAG: methyltransferase domain-containing protein [Solirubrobacterales bacterium]|nr:methyltransferase domain-containing protein [Solirubrobacterales bacterium]
MNTPAATEPATADPPTAGYVLDANWHAERARLDSLTRLYDPRTLAVCDQLGLAAGWRCLDVGAGTGSLALALAERVAPAGSVVALDIDTRFLEPLAAPRLETVALDVTEEPLPRAEFDLVHSRLLLEHFPARGDVLENMIGAVKPGAWVLIEDFDWVTALVVDPSSDLHRRMVSAIRSVFIRHGYDPHYGRTLPRRLRAAGLTDVGTRAEAIQVDADPLIGVPQWELLADQFAPSLLSSGLVDQADLDAFHELLHDGHTVCFAPLMVSCWGKARA